MLERFGFCLLQQDVDGIIRNYDGSYVTSVICELCYLGVVTSQLVVLLDRVVRQTGVYVLLVCDQGKTELVLSGLTQVLLLLEVLLHGQL